MRNEIVLDLETKSAPRDWAVRDELAALGVSVAGVWSLANDQMRVFREPDLRELGGLLKNADRLVGFAIRKFDLPVLQPYLDFDLGEIPTLDMFEEVSRVLGHRISLASLAKATLHAEKSGHGLDAVEWYRAGDWERLEQYCLQDVRLTGELYRHGKERGHLLFESLVDRKVVSVPVAWGMQDEAEVRALVARAQADGRAMEIEYVSREDAGDGFRKTRRIEIQSARGDEIEAYDHLRGEVRTFRIGRIVTARLLDDLVRPRPVVQSLFPA